MFKHCAKFGNCKRFKELDFRHSAFDPTRHLHSLSVCLSVRPSLDRTGPDRTFKLFVCLSVRPSLDRIGPDAYTITCALLFSQAFFFVLTGCMCSTVTFCLRRHFQFVVPPLLLKVDFAIYVCLSVRPSVLPWTGPERTFKLFV